MNIVKYVIFCLLICISNANANNCKNFLTMQGDGQQMSIMLCMNTNFQASSNISKTNLSISSIHNQSNTTIFSNSTNITNYENDFLSPPNITNASDLLIVEPAETPSPTTSSPTTQSPTTQSQTTPSPTTPTSTTPTPTTQTPSSEPIFNSSTNLRGKPVDQNTKNNSDSSETDISREDKQLEEGIIVIIIVCICMTVISVTTLIIVLCKHKKCCKKDKCCKKKETEKSEVDIEAQESLKKPKGRRVSPTNEKIEQLQYTNTYRNSQKLKKASSTLSAVERLKQFREQRDSKQNHHQREAYPRVPPGMKPLPNGPPPRLPPPAPQVAMKQAKKIMDRKNRNSWSIKELPNNAQNKHPSSPEETTDKIMKTNGSHNLGQSKQ